MKVEFEVDQMAFAVADGKFSGENPAWVRIFTANAEAHPPEYDPIRDFGLAEAMVDRYGGRILTERPTPDYDPEIEY